MSYRCGTVAIVGRPNVGKSTLLNRLVDARISITSRKAQTTRYAIRGIRTTDEAQFIFIDTPGFQTQHGGALNRSLNASVRTAIAEADVCVFLLAAGGISAGDRLVWSVLEGCPQRIIAVNKIDRAEARRELLPFLSRVAEAFPGPPIIPVSARTGDNEQTLLGAIAACLPEQPAIYPADELTDRDERFLAAERVREKLLRNLGEEVPHGCVVSVELFQMEGAMRRIHCVIYVDRAGHKPIILGRGGERLKTIASEARRDMEALFGGKVFLDVWVKVKSGWSEDPRSLRQFGFQA
jgi:GTP-binding protein Era